MADIFNTNAPVDDPYGEMASARADYEQQREQDTNDLLAALQDFARAYKWPHTLKVIAWAAAEQPELFK